MSDQIEAAYTNPALERYGNFVRLFLALTFLAMVYLVISGPIGGNIVDPGGRTFLIIAALVGGYMAMNIGANDVANNVGPAVGSGALTLTAAIIVALIFESAGALIAGGDVVNTIKKGIIDPSMIKDSQVFVWAMLAALLAAAIWLNIATYVGAPVSTTHSIVGGVLGAGIAAGGWAIADWGKVQQIVASWIISPAMGGLIAAMFLYGITHTILYKKDMIAAARNRVPVLLGIMAWAFPSYIILKGIKKLVKLIGLTAITDPDRAFQLSQRIRLAALQPDIGRFVLDLAIEKDIVRAADRADINAAADKKIAKIK